MKEALEGLLRIKVQEKTPTKKKAIGEAAIHRKSKRRGPGNISGEILLETKSGRRGMKDKGLE